MASTPTSGQVGLTTGSPPATSANSYARTTGINIQAGERPQHALNDDDSGDEWGIEIPVGDLIIDLDADLQKDEQRKNDARNTNNNNSIKGGGSMSNSEVSNTSQAEGTDVNGAGATKIFKPSATGVHTTSGTGSVTNKSKSKPKKSSKSAAGNKHATLSAGAVGKTDLHVIGESHIRNGAKSEAGISTKSSRSQKKHNKALNNCDKRGDNGSIGSKEVRDKSSKAGKVSSKHGSPFNTSTTLSSVKPAFPSTLDVMSPSALGHSVKSSRGMPVHSSAVHNSLETVPTTGEDGPHMDAVNNVGAVECADSLPSSGNFRNEVPIVKSASSFGKHKKSMAMPPAAKYNNTTKVHVSKANDIAAGRSAEHRATTGKRDRSNINGGLPNSNKKIKMEKINKGYVSGMTPVDGGNLIKANTGSPVNISGNPPEQSSTKTDSKMTVGQQKSSNEARTDRRSSSRNSSKIAKSSNTGNAAISTGQECPALPQREGDGSDERVRSVGTLTTHSDIGISAEPESLGPCEPGTNVNLSGIVWHETESGVLVVNVTWRNRSYVGTLLDATKHDWAPPRIPDVDSDVEFRLKSGRSKRQRAGNGNSIADGRKSRKSAAAAAAAAANNNNNDDYKGSPSTSNKRRSNKISESDICSGNDGDICATPSKSAKRARMARTAAGKQSAQRAVNTATAVKESSGDGTSGSGSSTCSSPVFVECSFANCKKRYSDETALKYHEVYAHKDEEMEKASEKAANDVDSLADADSPKDSENASSKSNDETLASDANCISNVPENDPSTSTKTLKPMEVEPSSTTQVSPATQTPFVVTQPSVTMTTTSKIMEKYPPTSFCHSNDSNPTVSDESVFTKAGEEKRTSRLSAKNFETGRQASQAVERCDRALSPYTLTDSLTNESISLKNHTSNKASPLSYHQRPTTAYGDVQGLPCSQSTLMEHSNAVDNESAQAVQTLLQLQENTHDQLPGLTPYSQHSRSTTIQTPKDAPPSTSSASYGEMLGEKFPRGQSPESMNKPQHHGIANPPFRGHPKDGAPLPRMTVRVSSPRNQYANGQFVNVNYPHGAVTANSPQERAVHPPPSGGLKTVKGKTVPIPTDPQQNLSSLQMQSPAAVVSNHSLPSSKKQKRKKQRPEFTSKSPSEGTPRLGSTELQEPGRAKQEHPQTMANAPLHTTPRGPHEVDNRAHAAPSHPNLRDGDIKTEPVSSTLNLPSGSKPPNSPQVSANQTPRAKPYMQSNMDPREQAQPILLPSGNKPLMNKTPQSRVPTEQTMLNRPAQHPSHSGFVDDRTDTRGKPQHGLSSSRNDATHSLPGSRSLTPVNTGNQATSKATRQNRSQGASGHVTQAPVAKEPVPHLPSGNRRLSGDGVSETKRTGAPQHQMYGQFPLPYGGDVYQAEFMHHPKMTSFFEHLITQEYQKDQKPKETQREAASQGRVGRSTPSPAEATKQSRAISPHKEGRRNLESPRGQPHFSSPYPSQIQAPPQRVLHNVQRGSTPRASPVPSESGSSRMHSGVSIAPRGPSPRVTPPPSHAGKRPPRPNSGAEKFHRREGSMGERPPTTSRTPTATPVRKQQVKEGYPEQRIPSPEKKPGGQHPQTLFPSPSPNVPMQLAGNRPQVQFYPGYSPLIDPRSIAYSFPAAAAYMFPGGPHLFQAPWPHGGPPPGVTGAGPPEKPQTPHSSKPSRDRPSSGSRSPFREETERMVREGPRARDVETYAGSSERRMADAPTQVRKSVTPDPKAQSVRGPQGEGDPPMQRHLHTHHHIHEGFHVLPPHAAQYGYPLAAPAVIAGTEAALAPYPKREIP